MQFTGARAFGPALAGLVLAEFGPGTAFLANAASFLLVIGALLLIAARPVHPAAPRRRALRSSGDALRYIRKRAVLIVSVLGALFSSLLGVSMIQLAEPFARQVLHEGAGKYGLLVAAYGVGAITGSVVTVARGDVWRRSTLTVVGFAIFVVAELTFGLAPVYALALVGMYGIGLAQSFAMVACQTAVQVNVDEHYRGRVLSVYVMSFFAGTPDRRARRRHRGVGDRAARDDRGVGGAAGDRGDRHACSATRGSGCSTRPAWASTRTSRTTATSSSSRSKVLADE